MASHRTWFLVALVLCSAAIVSGADDKTKAADSPTAAAAAEIKAETDKDPTLDEEYTYGNYEYGDDDYSEDWWEAYYEEDIIDDLVGVAPLGKGGVPSTETPAAGSSTTDTATNKSTPSKPGKKNKTVKIAEEAELINGIDDILPEGNCTAEIKKFCKSVKPGKGRLADCITQQALEDEEDDQDKGTVNADCKEEVMQYKIQRNRNINANIPLAKACKKDADKLCNVTSFFGYRSGQVIACLREESLQSKLTKRCKRQVFRIKMDAAIDYRSDATLFEACKGDADQLCKDVRPGMGRIQACLRKERMRVSWLCEEELFRQEVENADNIMLSYRLYRKCMPDKRRFCSLVEAGNANVKECLEENRNDPEFSAECKQEIDSMIERRVQDFRLDSRLKAACAQDSIQLCAFFGDLDTLEADDSSLVHCLQDYVEEIKDEGCQAQVVKYIKLASEDIRFDIPLAEACYEDRSTLCANVPPGSARVIRCLESQRDKLSATCRATLFDEEVRFSENIDFQFPMKQACDREIQVFCKGLPHGHARVIRCLQDNKKKKNFGAECRKEVTRFEQSMSEDYRMNYRLRTSCASDINKLCKEACKINDDQVCGGNMLRCLTDKKDEIQNEQCAKEVFYFEKMEVSDYRNDVLLANACHDDVDKLCNSVEPGDGRVHQCLRKNRAKLSPSCKKEELLLEQAEAENIELRPTLLQACSDERQLFCKDVDPGAGRVFRCLAESMGDLDFGDSCRVEVRNKLARRQSNWKLDPSLRRACREDVKTTCSAEDAKNSEEGLVIKCLIRTIDAISSGCAREVGRAVHMAFFTWHAGNVLTAPCDEDIERLCLKARPNADRTPGAIGTCIATILEEAEKDTGAAGRSLLATSPAAEQTLVGQGSLSTECHALALVAEPPDMRKAFMASLTVASLMQDQLDKMESATGLDLVQRDHRGAAQALTLTGWTAMAGMFAFLGLVTYGAWFAYRRYRGMPDHDYTLVVKGGSKGASRR